MVYYQKFTAYQLDNDSTLTTPNESREASNRAGKFECGYSYTAYIWDRMLAWGDYPDDSSTSELWESYGVTEDMLIEDCDADLPYVYKWVVTMLDILYFPELSNVSSVYLYEDNFGFVCTYQINTRDSDHLEFWGI